MKTLRTSSWTLEGQSRELKIVIYLYHLASMFYTSCIVERGIDCQFMAGICSVQQSLYSQGISPFNYKNNTVSGFIPFPCSKLLLHCTHGVKDKNAPCPHSSVGFLCYRRHIGKQKYSGRSLRGSTSVNILSKMHWMLCFLRYIGIWEKEKVIVSEVSFPEWKG